MHDINLLRPLIQQDQEKAKSRGRLSFYITFTIILVLLITGVIFGAKFYLLNQGKSLDTQISNAEKDLKEVKEIEDKINAYNSAISQLKSLDKNKKVWSEIYSQIAKCTPADIELTQVVLVTNQTTGGSSNASSSAAGASASIKLKITGISKSRRSIALFQEKLQKAGGNFTTVDIISSKEQATPTPSASSNPEIEAYKASAGATGGAVQAASTEGKADFEIDITLKQWKNIKLSFTS